MVRWCSPAGCTAGVKQQTMHHKGPLASPAQRVALQMPQLPARALQPQGQQNLAPAARGDPALLPVAAQGHRAEAPPALQQGRQQTVKTARASLRNTCAASWRETPCPAGSDGLIASRLDCLEGGPQNVPDPEKRHEDGSLLAEPSHQGSELNVRIQA